MKLQLFKVLKYVKFENKLSFKYALLQYEASVLIFVAYEKPPN